MVARIALTDPTEGAAAVVVSAAMQLFSGTPVPVVLFVPGVDDVPEELGALVQALCRDGAVGDLPETLLLGEAEARSLDAGVEVASGRTAADAAASCALLAAFAQQLVSPVAALEAQALRAEVMQRWTARDARSAAAIARGERPVRVALLFQHRAYWNAVATVVEALQADPRAELVVAALDSEADGTGASTAAFLRSVGVLPISADGLVAMLDDVDVVVFDNPYDEMRPEPLTAASLARRGVRTAVVPYGGGAIGGELMDTLLWNLPLMQLAWRSYVPTQDHVAMYDRHCRTGSAHVRVAGNAKLDRLLSAEKPHNRKPVVLWNPHFRIGEGGWSTFDLWFEPVLRWFMAHPDVTLLLRPHFRLWRDLAARGGVEAKVEETVRRLASEHKNIVLDDSPDYVASLARADALMSDLSSLATEFLALGRPLLYLHRADGPGPNAVGDGFDRMTRAETWDEIEAWLGAVRRGTAPVPEAGDLGPLDGRSGARIADDLVTSLVAALVHEPSSSERAAVVTDVAVGPAGVTVQVDGAARVGWASGQVSGPLVEVGPSGAVLPWTASFFGASSAPLPSGTYRLVAEGARVEVAPKVWERAGLSWRDETCAVTVAVGGTDALELVVAPPVDRDTDRQTRVQRVAYRPAGQQPLEDSVVFTSYNGTAVACSPRALDRELVSSGLKRYWVVQDLSVAVPDGAVPVVQGSKEHYEAVARARFVVDNEAMPSWLDKRPGQVLLQTWHGTPLKKLRWDLHEVSPRDPSFMAEADRDAASWDFVLSPNPLSTEVLQRGFRVRGEVLELGYPRNDALFDPSLRAAVRARLGLRDDQRVVLHAPTWRDNAVRRSSRSGSWSYGATWSPQPVLDPALLGADDVLLYRGHRYVASTAAELRVPGVLDVSRYPDMTDLLAAADVLVTDYSSSMFDFALTGRPMVFFCPDLEAYRGSVRGHYFAMEDVVPGPVVSSTLDVAAALTMQLPVRGVPVYDAFVDRFGPWEDGGAARRVVERVFR